MKQYLLATLLLTVTLTAFSQDSTKRKGWTPADRKEFITSCTGTAEAGMSKDSASYYCQCMQEKVEKKYPTMEEVSRLSDTTFLSPEWQKEVKSCFGGWGTKDRSDFVKECVRTASAGMSEEKARSYCECMVFKVEKRFPRIDEVATKLTEAELSKPEWQKLIRECLGQ